MYYYFSCQYPSAIKLNGIFYGFLGKDVKSINILPGELPLIEICSLSGKEQTINFLPDKNFLTSPPDNVLITDMRGGYLINISSFQKNSCFKIIGQQKYSDSVITVFNENGVKVSIDCEKDFLADDISANITFVEFYRTEAFEVPLIGIKLGETNILTVYSLGEKIQKVYFRETAEFSFEGGFSTVCVFNDMAKHKVSTSWEYLKNSLSPKEQTISCSERWKINKLPSKLLPFAFLEELLVGGNLSEFLAENMLANADKLSGYLGNFIGIMPPPIFRSIDEVGLVFPNGKNKYIVNYIKTEIVENKIVNVKKMSI